MRIDKKEYEALVADRDSAREEVKAAREAASFWHDKAIMALGQMRQMTTDIGTLAHEMER